VELSTQQRAVARALQHGLPLVSHPYRELGARIGLDEAAVMQTIAQLLRNGVITRLGVIVRHHELGYHANAMVVWDVPDERVDDTGQWLGAQADVTLCYRRPRRPPAWPYNLFCMIHGHHRDAVRARIHALREASPLTGIPYAVLFSTRRFKQRGARYAFDDRAGSPADA
jgi:DNA-binding Lrp family transcriptional regulator